jgi:AcrR family transcriptional regulator
MAFVDLLQHQELDNISIRDIATSAGVGYSTFYRHYATRDELIAEIADCEVSAFFDWTFSQFFDENPSEVCRLAAQHIDQRQKFWRAMTSGPAAAILQERVMAAMLRLSEGYQFGSGYFSRELGASIIATIYVELLAWWLRQGGAYSVDYLAGAFERMIIEPPLKCW